MGHLIWSFTSLGNGQFTAANYNLGSGFDAGTGTWTTGDINGDGKTDLIYIYPLGDLIWTFTSLGNGQLTAADYSLGSGFDAGTGTWEV